MFDFKVIRENPEQFKEKIKLRGEKYVTQVDQLLELDIERRKYLVEVENLKKAKNEINKEIGDVKKSGGDINEILAKTDDINAEIKQLDAKVAKIDAFMKEILIMFPNTVHESVKVGVDENDNELIREVGKLPKFDFDVKPHYEIGEALGILDFKSAAKITGSRFVVLKGDGARLERALIAFMLDIHTVEGDYTEIIPPYIVNRQTMTAAGKLPKFEDDAFKLFKDSDWFLNSTAEVPLTGYFSNLVLEENELPINIAGYTTSFRREAGSAGRDTRGIFRQHQFNKVELFKVAHPDNSYDELEKMCNQAEKVLQKLEIPYRVVNLCTGDLGETSTKTYDIELWIPSQNKYREVSSVSNVETYQAIRANIKFKRTDKKKLEYVHLLNGSGLAVGRTMIAILENYQNADGTVTIPKALVPYMGKEVIK